MKLHSAVVGDLEDRACARFGDRVDDDVSCADWLACFDQRFSLHEIRVTVASVAAKVIQFAASMHQPNAPDRIPPRIEIVVGAVSV